MTPLVLDKPVGGLSIFRVLFRAIKLHSILEPPINATAKPVPIRTLIQKSMSFTKVVWIASIPGDHERRILKSYKKGLRINVRIAPIADPTTIQKGNTNPVKTGPRLNSTAIAAAGNIFSVLRVRSAKGIGINVIGSASNAPVTAGMPI